MWPDYYLISPTTKECQCGDLWNLFFSVCYFFFFFNLTTLCDGAVVRCLGTIIHWLSLCLCVIRMWISTACHRTCRFCQTGGSENWIHFQSLCLEETLDIRSDSFFWSTTNLVCLYICLCLCLSSNSRNATACCVETLLYNVVATPKVPCTEGGVGVFPALSVCVSACLSLNTFFFFCIFWPHPEVSAGVVTLFISRHRRQVRASCLMGGDISLYDRRTNHSLNWKQMCVRGSVDVWWIVYFGSPKISALFWMRTHLELWFYFIFSKRVHNTSYCYNERSFFGHQFFGNFHFLSSKNLSKTCHVGIFVKL